MSVDKTKNRPRPAPRKNESPARPVQQMLLELAYRMHATRVVRTLPADKH